MLERVAEAVQELVGADLDGLSPAALNDVVAELQRVKAMLDAAEAKVLARWDAVGAWSLDGASNGAAWLSWKSRQPAPAANQRIRCARAMRELPAIAQAWEAGDIDRTHVTALLSLRTPRTEAAFVDGHAELVELARTQRFRHFKRACDMWRNLADLEGAAQRDADDLDARELHFSESIGGLWFGRITADPVSGAIVNTTLRIIEQELYDADRAAAKERLGRDPMVFELGRTPAQRRLDALVEMAIRARTAPKDGRRPAPLFTVLSGFETFVGPVLEMWNGTVITPSTAARWLTEADIERVVFEGRSRVIDVGVRTRFFRGGQRRAVEVRDRSCFHPTCDEPPLRPQVDHKVEASKGGLTTLENGRLGCAFHNRLRNTRPDDWDEPDEPAAIPRPPPSGSAG